MFSVFRHLSRTEKLVTITFFAISCLSALFLGRQFFVESTTEVAAVGGVYTEGEVGALSLLNPVFSHTNAADDDVNALLFEGLMKFDAKTGDIVDALATHTLSADKTVYTFTLKDGVKWHDGEPVTADDVMYTYVSVLQNPDFQNTFLSENFKGVKIEKKDEKTVKFLLPEPYKFFLTNLTVGLLPVHILGDFPIKSLDKSEFSLQPIGAGPYQLRSISRLPNGATEVQLSRFEDYYGQKPNIPSLKIDLFSSYEELMQNASTLDGIREIPKDQPFPTKGFEKHVYHLPQYVGLFLNNDSPILGNAKTRLALQLLTDKKAVAATVNEEVTVDTPFLEVTEGDWKFANDPNRAAGALVDAGWQWPWKIKKPELKPVSVPVSTPAKAASSVAKPDIALADAIFEPTKEPYFVTGENKWYLEGKSPVGSKKMFVNGYPLSLFNPNKGTWSYRVDTAIGTLKEGENRYEIESAGDDGKKSAFDAITVFYSTDAAARTKWEAEQKAKYASSQPTALPKAEPKPEPKKELPAAPSASTGATTASGGVAYRMNDKGETLKLTLLTSASPSAYADVAENIAKQWEKGGVQVKISVLSGEAFSDAVAKRKYDILLFGQSLGYNSDAYPYWHSSQANEHGFNLSNYRSLTADDLLVRIRQTHKEDRRSDLMEKLVAKFAEEVPAIFLYSPEHVYAVSSKVMGVNMEHLAYTKDRFTNISDWFITQARVFTEGKGWKDLPGWIWGQL